MEVPGSGDPRQSFWEWLLCTSPRQGPLGNAGWRGAPIPPSFMGPKGLWGQRPARGNTGRLPRVEPEAGQPLSRGAAGERGRPTFLMEIVPLLLHTPAPAPRSPLAEPGLGSLPPAPSWLLRLAQDRREGGSQ